MIIGLHGRMGSGKDTFYELLKEEHTGEVIRRAFADPLKISAARALGFVGGTEACIGYCNMLKERGTIKVLQDNDEINEISGRQYLQWYGTEAHREVFGTNFWVDAALPEYDGMGHSEDTIFRILPRRDLVVFTDVRFANEAERVRQWGGEVWEVVRFDDDADGHASEQRLPRHLIDATIDNRGTLEDLREVARGSLNIVQARRDRVHLERIR